MSSRASITESSVTEVEQLRARLELAEAKLKAISDKKNNEPSPPGQNAVSSLQILNAILNAVPHPIFWKDRNLVFQGCNTAFAAEIGCSPEDIIGKTDSDLTDSALEKHLHAQDKQVIKSGHAILEPQLIKTVQNGQLKLESISKLPLRDSNGTTVGMLGTFSDVTAQKLAEQALRTSEKLFTAAFEHLASAMALVAANNGTWLRVNKVMCDMLGYTQEEFQRKTIYDLTHPDDLKNSQEHLDGLRAGNIHAGFHEKRFVHKHGHAIWTQVNEAMIQDEQDQSSYLILQIQEITDRKKAETDLEQMHRRLLEYARGAGMAELAISVLHNVGNVFNSINVSCSLATEKIRESQISHLAQVVTLMQEHEDDLARFINDDPKGRHLPGFLSKLSDYLVDERQEIIDELEFLDYNIQHVKQVISMQQVYATISNVTEKLDLGELVEDSLRLSMHSLERCNIQVKLDFSPVAPTEVEKQKVMQILINLIQNAKLACIESERKDKLLTLRLRDDENRVRISVIDNGVGIEPDMQSQLFDYGFTTKSGGLGIGLHSSALAAKEMGGDLSASSDGPGHGATFTLELPGALEG